MSGPLDDLFGRGVYAQDRSAVEELHSAELPLHHLALTFREDLSLNKPAREFLAAFARSRNLDPTEYSFVDYLHEVWPDGVPNTVYAANIGNDPTAASHFVHLLIRPVAEGPEATRPSVGGLTLALALQRRQGRLEVRKVEVSPHVQRRDFEVLVSAPIYWLDHELYMDAGDMTSLAGLPFHRAITRDRLLVWRKYLEWKDALIRKNQLSIAYDSWRWEGDTVIAFLVHEDELPERRLTRMELGVAPRPRHDEDDGDDKHRRRRRRRDPKITEIGEVEGKHRLNLRDKKDREGWGDLKLTDKHGRVRIRVEEERAELLRKGELPTRGLLMSSIAGDLAPLRNQQSGVDRLNNSQGFSPRLADFIFSSTSASVSVEVADDLPPVEGGRELNDGQRRAVARALAAPDLCLIQGPPGTGKTTVIADICLRAAIRGQRVLVASQTNLAVDNALARLSEASAVRPLRLGNPNRVDEEFKDFLAENVVERWFVSIAEQCRVRMRAAREDEAQLASREDAVMRLTGTLARLHALQRDASRASQGVTACRAALDQANVALQAAQTAEGAAKAEGELLVALAEWGLGDRALPAAAANHPLPGSVVTPPGLDASLPQLAALDRLSQVREPLKKVLETVDAAAVGSAPDPAAAVELRELRTLKLSLIDSDEMADLQRLRMVNRRIKELEGSGWNQLTGRLNRSARAVWGERFPACIAGVVDALAPSPETSAALADARELVQEHLGTSETAASAMAQASEAWLDEEMEQAKRQGTLSRTVEQAREALEAAQQRIDHALFHQQTVSRQLQEVQQGWTDAWRVAMPEAEVRAPSPDAHAEASVAVAELRASQGDRLARAARWRSIQGEWLGRLAKVSDSDREQLQALYVRRSNVVGMTCNEAGKRKTWQDAEFQPFDIVIVDEVSKATPPELILPMLLGEKSILVGDHRQLPPMFREREASFGEATANGEVTEADYGQFKSMVTASLFEELFEQAPDAIKAMLWTQYRMHPAVMAAVNQFYAGRLEAGPDDITLAGLRQHHLEIAAEGGGKLLSPKQHLLWLDSSKGPDGKPVWEDQAGTSKINWLEVDLVVHLLLRLGRSLLARGYGQTHEIETDSQHVGSTWRQVVEAELQELPEETLDELFTERRVRVEGRAQLPDDPARAGVVLRVRAQKEVGVITFYGAQLKEIRKEIDRCRAKNKEPFAAMELRTNTVDRFQGMEKPIIICSLVRASRQKLGAFVREYQRINVGLSRAQQLLVVVGAEDTWKHALVPLPPLDGGPVVDTPAYRNILELARRSGGRRVARQVLFR